MSNKPQAAYNLVRFEPVFRAPLRGAQEPYIKVKERGVYMNRFACDLLRPLPCRVAFFLDRDAKVIKIERENGGEHRNTQGMGNYRIKYQPAQLSAELNERGSMPLGVYRYIGAMMFIHESVAPSI